MSQTRSPTLLSQSRYPVGIITSFNLKPGTEAQKVSCAFLSESIPNVDLEMIVMNDIGKPDGAVES